MVKLTHHSRERIAERFNNDPCFEIKFRWALKQVKRGIIKEKNGKRPNTSEVIYDHIKFIYQKIGSTRRLVTTFMV